jgi:hypothetical protein
MPRYPESIRQRHEIPGPNEISGQLEDNVIITNLIVHEF